MWTELDNACLNVLRAHLGVRGLVHTVHNLTRFRISTLAPPTGIWYKHRINKRDVKWALRLWKNYASQFRAERGLLCLLRCQHWYWSLSSFLCSGHRELHHSIYSDRHVGSIALQFTTSVNNAWGYTSISQNICFSFWWTAETLLPLCCWKGIAP